VGARENLWLLNTQQVLVRPELSGGQPQERAQRPMTLSQRTEKGFAAAASPVASTSTAKTAPAYLATISPPTRKEKVKRAPRTGEPTSSKARMQPRWFGSWELVKVDAEDVLVEGNMGVSVGGDGYVMDEVQQDSASASHGGCAGGAGWGGCCGELGWEGGDGARRDPESQVELVQRIATATSARARSRLRAQPVFLHPHG